MSVLVVLGTAACGSRAPGGAGGTTGGAAGMIGSGGSGGTIDTSGSGGTGGSSGAVGGSGGSGGSAGSAGSGGSAGSIDTSGSGGSGGMVGGSGGSGGSSGGAGGQGGGDPTALCSAWTGDLAAQNQRALERQGFYQAKAILEGTLGERFDQATQSYARFTIGKVRAGVTSYEGREVAIAMSPALHATFGSGASVLLGLSSTYSFMDDALPVPPNPLPTNWSNLLAVVKKADEAGLPADLIGFRAWHAPNVAVVRVRELPPGRIAFDVVETLAGSLPATFVANWSGTWGPLPVAVGDERVAGFGEIVTIMGTVLATEIVELRPNSADERARAARGIAALAAGGFAATYRGELDRARDEATRYRLAWTFSRSERVLEAEVAGFAGECCTDLGGTFFANTVGNVLRGAAPAGPVVTGGHGVNLVDACGDRYLYAMRSVATTASGTLGDFRCTTPVTTQISSSVASSTIDARLPATAANRDDVALWLRSAPPLLRLHDAAGADDPGALMPQSAPALFSVPVPATTAIQARHALALLTIVDVQQQPAGGYVVRMSTPLYHLDISGATIRDVKLFVPCADPRLLQPGRRLVGAVMGTEPYATSLAAVGTQITQGRLMLVPGFLLPAEREDLIRTADGLAQVAIPRPLGR